ncbi:unnamed protein product [Brachionus calyciflorus]|uniref:Uncharacterized protein n=1 Tax=Brachionus calyciflorus TaxID=104777 RepID=A0A813XKG9_9BILA|nr:unnamed protein product [Brachionus calyciflorus]
MSSDSESENLKQEKRSTKYFVAYTICSKCAKDGLKYQFHVQNKPLEIRANGGSALAFVERKIGEDNSENVPTTDVVRKILQEDRNKETPFSNLFDNLMFVSMNQKNCINSSKLPSFTREITKFDEFSYILHSEKQITSIDLIPPENRILHIDATGQFVRITGPYKYKQPFNHFALLKDSRSMGYVGSKSLLVGEMLSTRQDTDQIFKFQKKLTFRLIVSDFSFANKHAILRAYNNENMHEYSVRVFRLSAGYIEAWPAESSKRMTWLCSCASHTMKRFVYCVRDLSLSIEEPLDKETFNQTKNDSIKANSRFTKYFLEIENDVKNQIKLELKCPGRANSNGLIPSLKITKNHNHESIPELLVIEKTKDKASASNDFPRTIKQDTQLSLNEETISLLSKTEALRKMIVRERNNNTLESLVGFNAKILSEIVITESQKKNV